MKIKTKQPKDYDAAYAELEEIIEYLQSDGIGVEILGDLVKRAKVLSVFCKERLRQIETNIEEIKSQED